MYTESEYRQKRVPSPIPRQDHEDQEQQQLQLQLYQKRKTYMYTYVNEYIQRNHFSLFLNFLNNFRLDETYKNIYQATEGQRKYLLVMKMLC